MQTDLNRINLSEILLGLYSFITLFGFVKQSFFFFFELVITDMAKSHCLEAGGKYYCMFYNYVLIGELHFTRAAIKLVH